VVLVEAAVVVEKVMVAVELVVEVAVVPERVMVAVELVVEVAVVPERVMVAVELVVEAMARRGSEKAEPPGSPPPLGSPPQSRRPEQRPHLPFRRRRPYPLPGRAPTLRLPFAS